MPRFTKKRTIFILFCSMYLLALRAACAQVVVPTQHNDNARSGLNPAETLLTPSKATWKKFGKLVSYGVDGFIVAQPLYIPGVNFPGSGLHNAVYVATQHDSVYAFDADGRVTTPLWHVSFINPAANIVTETIAQEGCPETGFTEIGIMGTPVIDTTTSTLYVVAKTVENGVFIFRLHALDLATGADKLNPVQITATAGNGQGGIVTLNSYRMMQRPGLLLSNGVVYIGFGSNGCDFSSYGWVIAYDATSLQQLGVFNADPEKTYGGSVWQSGGGLAGDSAGYVYFMTANGDFDGVLDFGDSFLKLVLAGGTLSQKDYFSPSNQSDLNAKDLDLGSGGVMLLPDQPGAHLHLMVGAGKGGTIYLVDRDNLGGYNSTDNVVQELPGALGQVFSVPAYWNNRVYFVATTGPLKAYSISNGLLSSSPVAQTYNIAARGLPSISSNGTSNGIVWLLRGQYSSPLLTAYNASGTGSLAQVYSSNQAPNNRDVVGPIAHFATPTIAGGRVYVGTQSQLVIYGLFKSLNVWYGNNQSGPAGTMLPLALKVKAVDPYTGAAISGVTVSFSDGGVGGTFGSPIAVTDVNGVAGTTYTLPATPQVVYVTASATRFAGATFTETAK